MVTAARPRLALRRQHADLIAITDHQEAPVAAGLEPVQLAEEFLAGAPGEVEPLECGTRLLAAGLGGPLTERPGHRLPEPREAAPDGPQRRVPGFGHGNLDDAPGEAIGIDGHRPRPRLGGAAIAGGARSRGTLWPAVAVVIDGRPAAGQRGEGRTGRRGERHEVRAAPVG